MRRRYPTLPIALFTDRPDHLLCQLDRFDTVTTIDSVSGLGSGWAEGQLNRLRCLPLTPYARTLHLDTDTRLLTPDLPWLFSLLEVNDAGLVEAVPDASFSRAQYGRPMFNAGVILYRNTSLMLECLAEWLALSDRNFRWASQTPLPPVGVLQHIADEQVRRRLMYMDQTSLAEILSPEVNTFGLALVTLAYPWNDRGSRDPANRRSPVKILHTPALKGLTHPDLMDLAFDWRQAGRTAQAQQIEDYLATKYPVSGGVR